MSSYIENSSSDVGYSSSEPILSSSSSGVPGISYGQLEDSRDSQTYPTVTIGSQIWMARNLNFDYSSSRCINDNPDKCEVYGRLYNWDQANNNICPNQWSLPTQQDWITLAEAVGSFADAGKKLKADNSLWATNTGTDNFGFSGLPSGFAIGDEFYSEGAQSIFWSATEEEVGGPMVFIVVLEADEMGMNPHYKTNFNSVRCLQTISP
jgi:uncharacterized protein (TIGR02145 family)